MFMVLYSLNAEVIGGGGGVGGGSGWQEAVRGETMWGGAGHR